MTAEYWEGYQAREDGFDVTVNPYNPNNCDDYASWNSGWQAANSTINATPRTTMPLRREIDSTQVTILCPTCHSNGVIDYTNATCPRCGGSGYIHFKIKLPPCNVCGGAGLSGTGTGNLKDLKMCQACNGSGYEGAVKG